MNQINIWSDDALRRSISITIEIIFSKYMESFHEWNCNMINNLEYSFDEISVQKLTGE